MSITGAPSEGRWSTALAAVDRIPAQPGPSVRCPARPAPAVCKVHLGWVVPMRPVRPVEGLPEGREDTKRILGAVRSQSVRAPDYLAAASISPGSGFSNPRERFLLQSLGYLAAASISPGENAQFRDLNCSRRSHRSVALYQGTTLELAEKLMFLKGTAFRPYVNALK